MKISDLTWSVYHIPFRKPFITAHGPLSERVSVLVSVRTNDGYMGHGEIAPLPSQSGASLETVLNALPGVARELRGLELASISNIPTTRNIPTMYPSSLVCGLEIALLDVVGQACGQSVAALLACDYPSAKGFVPRTHVPVNAVIGGETIDAVVTQARKMVDAGFGCLKLKIVGTSEKEIERVAEVRAAIGAGPSLRLDANEGWSFEQAREILTRCAPYDIQYVEQPLPAADLTGMARLRRISPIPLAADEVLTGLESAWRVLDAEAADVLILKPQLAEGLLTCREIIQLASERNVACVITSTLEAGIGVAAALHLAAASPTVTLPCGLATLDLLEDDLLWDGLAIEQGCMAVPDGPGLGVALDEDALRCYTV